MGLKGAYPPYLIIGIIIAVLVLAVLAYWFFSTTGKGGTEVDLGFCKAKYSLYCFEKSKGLEIGFAEYEPKCALFADRPEFNTC